MAKNQPERHWVGGRGGGANGTPSNVWAKLRRACKGCESLNQSSAMALGATGKIDGMASRTGIGNSAGQAQFLGSEEEFYPAQTHTHIQPTCSHLLLLTLPQHFPFHVSPSHPNLPTPRLSSCRNTHDNNTPTQLNARSRINYPSSSSKNSHWQQPHT